MRPTTRISSQTEELAILRQNVHHVTEKLNISAKAKKSFVTVSNQWKFKYSFFFSLTNLFNQN